MHTATNCLSVNLAFSDIITISMAPLFVFAHLNGYPSDGFGKFACKLLPVTEISIVVSSFTLKVLEVERYHALLKPLRAGLRLKEDNIKQAIALIWISSFIFLFAIFRLSGMERHTFNMHWSLKLPYESRNCKLCHHKLSIRYLYSTDSNALLLSGSLIKGLYFTNTVCPETDRERSAEKKRLVITFIIATAGFTVAIGYGSFIVFYTVIASKGDKQIGFKLYSDISSVIVFLFNCSLCLNPILYAFRSTNFKEGFKRIIVCRQPTPPHEIQL